MNKWDKHWKGKKQKTTHSKKRLMKVLDKYINKKMKVLDAGCGTGFFSDYFQRKGCDVFGLDNSDKALYLTKESNNKINVIKGNIFKLPFKNNSMDMVFSDGLLEHFKKPETILTNFKRILKKNGLMVTVVPNKFSYWNFIKPFKLSHIDEYRFGLEDLSEKHRNKNLEIIEKGGLNVLPVGPSPEFLGNEIGRLIYVIARKV